MHLKCPMSDIISKIIDVIESRGLIEPGDRVLAAVSGGVDSVSLLHVLFEIQSRLDFSLAAAHFDHCLRGEESQRDAEFTAGLCKSLKVELFSGSWDDKPAVIKGSLQAAAHAARFRFFDSIMRKHGFTKIALGHHSDDQVETVVMALLKGYGVNALRGIQSQAGNRIHPLLAVSREEILEYALAAGLQWVEDSSNVKDVYLRNRLRHGLLSETFTSREVLKREAIRLSEAADTIFGIIEKQADILLKKASTSSGNQSIILAIDEILPYFNLLGEFVIRSIYSTLNSDYYLTPGCLKQVERMFFSGTGSTVEIGGVSIGRDRDNLLFTKTLHSTFRIEVKREEDYNVAEKVFSVKQCSIGEVEFVNDGSVEFIDSDALKGGLFIRQWQEGDVFIPYGMSGSKKLSDFFIDEKIPRYEKKRIPILYDADKVVWICGFRLDNRVRIKKTSTDILKLSYK